MSCKDDPLAPCCQGCINFEYERCCKCGLTLDFSLEEDVDPCICIPDEPNPMCESCF